MLRKVIRLLPEDSLRWCYLAKDSGRPFDTMSLCKQFSRPVAAHWRLRAGLLERLAWGKRAPEVAKEILEWIRPFAPEVLWVLAEGDTIELAPVLQKRLGVPVHLTFHDAPEVCAKLFVNYGRLAIPLYLKRVARLVRIAGSIDAITEALIGHIQSCFQPKSSCRKMYFPPSTLPVPGLTSPVFPKESGPARIAVCGSARVSTAQWKSFLSLLGSLNRAVEVVVYSDRNYFPEATVPGGVNILFREYVQTEWDLIRQFAAGGFHACYLGIWKEEDKRLFCRTSLSSKLATYAAAGLPIIVDGPQDSAAWTLVNKYGAGILLYNEGGKRDSGQRELEELFCRESGWNRMSAGSTALGREELNLGLYISKFTNLLAESVVQGGK